MIEPMLRNAPNHLAALDRNLVCRQASHGWLERFGLSAEKQALAMPLDALFELEDQAELPDQLRDFLRNGTPLREAPATLTGTSGMTRGLLSAWRGEARTGSGNLGCTWPPPATTSSTRRCRNCRTCELCTS